MKVVIQRVANASVKVDERVVGAIEKGLMVLVGFEAADDLSDLEWLCKKVLNMRIFPDEKANMNVSVEDVAGQLLVVSQFTLHASTKKGNRPSFIQSAPPEQAEALYLQWIQMLENHLPGRVKTGAFGAHMEVGLVNDGPVTIVVDSKNRV